MKTSEYRGHPIEYVNDVWIYSDNKTPVAQDKNRACGHCHKPSTPEGHDDCLGTLPGIMNACCGHGCIEEMYIQFLDGFCIRGKNAQVIIDVLKESVHGNN